MLNWKEVFEVPDLIFCPSRDRLNPDLKQLCSNMRNQVISDSLKKSVKYVVYQDQVAYAQHVTRLVNEALSSGQTGPFYDEIRVMPGIGHLKESPIRQVIKATVKSLGLLSLAKKVSHVIRMRLETQSRWDSAG